MKKRGYVGFGLAQVCAAVLRNYVKGVLIGNHSVDSDDEVGMIDVGDVEIDSDDSD